jgi:hypothetical protein
MGGVWVLFPDDNSKKKRKKNTKKDLDNRGAMFDGIKYLIQDYLMEKLCKEITKCDINLPQTQNPTAILIESCEPTYITIINNNKLSMKPAKVFKLLSLNNMHYICLVRLCEAHKQI